MVHPFFASNPICKELVPRLLLACKNIQAGLWGDSTHHFANWDYLVAACTILAPQFFVFFKDQSVGLLIILLVCTTKLKNAYVNSAATCGGLCE